MSVVGAVGSNELVLSGIAGSTRSPRSYPKLSLLLIVTAAGCSSSAGFCRMAGAGGYASRRVMAPIREGAQAE